MKTKLCPVCNQEMTAFAQDTFYIYVKCENGHERQEALVPREDRKVLTAEEVMDVPEPDQV